MTPAALPPSAAPAQPTAAPVKVLRRRVVRRRWPQGCPPTPVSIPAAIALALAGYTPDEIAAAHGLRLSTFRKRVAAVLAGKP